MRSIRRTPSGSPSRDKDANGERIGHHCLATRDAELAVVSEPGWEKCRTILYLREISPFLYQQDTRLQIGYRNPPYATGRELVSIGTDPDTGEQEIGSGSAREGKDTGSGLAKRRGH